LTRLNQARPANDDDHINSPKTEAAALHNYVTCCAGDAGQRCEKYYRFLQCRGAIFSALRNVCARPSTLGRIASPNLGADIAALAPNFRCPNWLLAIEFGTAAATSGHRSRKSNSAAPRRAVGLTYADCQFVSNKRALAG